MDKNFDILDNFTPKVRILEFKLESICECTESTIGLV